MIQTFLLNFVSAYRNHYKCKPCINKSDRELDNNEIVGEVFMDYQHLSIVYMMIYLKPKWKPMATVRTFLLFCIHT